MLADDRVMEYHKNRAVSGEENNERKLEKMSIKGDDLETGGKLSQYGGSQIENWSCD